MAVSVVVVSVQRESQRREEAAARAGHHDGRAALVAKMGQRAAGVRVAGS